jgi:hypothetical protein
VFVCISLTDLNLSNTHIPRTQSCINTCLSKTVFVCISLTDLNLSNTHIPRTQVHQQVLIQDSVCLYFTDRSQPVNNSTTPRYRLWTNAAKVVPDQTEAGCVALCAAETKDVCLGVTFSHTTQNGNNSCYLIAPPLLHWDAEPGTPYPPNPMRRLQWRACVCVCVCDVQCVFVL